MNACACDGRGSGQLGKIGGLLIMLGAFALAGNAACAQTADTLEKIRKDKVLVVGVRDNNLPFSTLNGGSPTGYAVDLCSRVLDQVRKELKMSDIRIQYVPVTAADRVAKLKDGSIDIECGQTVNTQSRAQEVSFSYSYFVAGEKIMTRKDANIADYEGLGNQSVAVVKGTTAEKLFTQLRDGKLKTMRLVAFNNNQEAIKALESGKVAAFAQVDITLESQRLLMASPDKYVISPKALSVEPMGLMLRKDDKALRSVADRALSNLYSSGEINSIYDKWFNSGALKFPMSQMLRECLTRPSHDAGVALGLGYAL